MMSRRIHVPLVAALLLASGCGEESVPPEEAAFRESVRAKVDESLPQDLQQKQAALKQALDKIMIEFIQPNEVRDHIGINFTESPQSFWEGASEIVRWDFDGKPAGDDLPVVITFAMDDTGENTREVKRVYAVVGWPGNWTISRKSGS